MRAAAITVSAIRATTSRPSSRVTASSASPTRCCGAELHHGRVLRLSEGIYNFEQLVANPLTIESGRTRLDPSPGIVVELDWDVVRRHALAETSAAAGHTYSNGHPTGELNDGRSKARHVAARPEARSTATHAAKDPVEG
jgi:hypothetical protein